MQAGLVGFGLHAALAQDHVAGEGGGLGLLLVARGAGADEGRCLALRRGVVDAGTLGLDVGAGAVGRDLGTLGLAEFLARHPVQVAVVGAARSQCPAAIVAGQRRRLRLTARRGCGRRLLGVAADGGCGRLRARRQGGAGRLRRTGPAATSGGLAVELLGGMQEWSGTQGQQTAGDEEGELSAEQGGI
ncbi:hypothetical protein D3C78_1166540 [compost metagenome]